MQALYRRYRPDTFEDVIGQEHVTKALQASLANGRINHAYLFSGPRGCGKTTSARIMARCLNCHNGPTPTPCGQCPSCLDLATGGPGSMDVVEIDAASHGGVEDARELRERATFAPARDRFKIFILDEAHMVTASGFNALLKLVEEPPEHVKFIFATTEPDHVIGTIRSRTHHYPFRLVAPEVLREYLGDLCAKEGVQVQDGVLGLVVRAGGGSVRDSLSILDQLIAGENGAVLHYDRAVALLGYTDVAMLGGLVDALVAGDGTAAYAVAERMMMTGNEPRRFVEDLLQYFRDLVVMKLAGGPNLLGDLPQTELDLMKPQVAALSGRVLTRLSEVTHDGLMAMQGASSPRLALELLVAQLLMTVGAVEDAAPVVAPVAVEKAAPVEEQPVAVAPVVAPVPEQPVPEQPVVASKPEPTLRESSSTEWKFTPTPWGEPQIAASTTSTAIATDKAESVPAAITDPAPETPERPPQVDANPAPQTVPSAAQPGPAAPANVLGDQGSEYEKILGSWAQVLDWLRENAAATGNLVSTHGQPQGIRNGTLEIAFTAPGLLRAFGERHTSAASRALKEVLGIALPVTGVVSGFGAPQPGTQPAPQTTPQPATPPAPQPAQPASPPAPTLAPQTPPQPATPPAPQPAQPASTSPSAKRELPEKPGKEMAQAILGGQFVQSDPRGRR